MTGPRGVSWREVITMAWDFAATWIPHSQQPPGEHEAAPAGRITGNRGCVHDAAGPARTT